MHIKVDYSIDCKTHDYDISRPGSYAIYTREHWWNKWIEQNKYADLEYCESQARKISRLPLYFR